MTTERFNFITRDEFMSHEFKVGQKFEDLTTIMLGEFDKMHIKFGNIDTQLEEINHKLDAILAK